MTNFFRQLKTLSQQEAFRRTLGYYLVYIGLGVDLALLGTTLPYLAEQTGSTLGQMAYYFLAGSIGFMVGSTLGGRIFDYVAGHPVLGGAQAVGAVCLALIPIFPQPGMLVLLLVVKGIMQGTINNGANILLVWTHQSKVGPYMNGLHFFFGLGAFLAPFLVAQAFAAGIGYSWVFWILAGLALLVGLVIFIMPGSPQPVHTTKRSLVSAPEKRKNGGYFVFLAAIFLLFYVGSEISYGNWIYTYAFTLNLLDKVKSAYMVSVFWLAFTTSRLIAIFMAAHFSSRQIIRTAITGCLISLLLAITVPGSASALWAVTIGLGFSMGPIYPTAVTLVGQSLKLTARTAGMIFLGDSIGGMVFPWLAGQLIESSGPRALVYLVLASLVGSLFAFLGMVKTRVRRLPTQPGPQAVVG